VEYISYALHTLSDGMSSAEQEDMLLLLDSLTTKMSAKVSHMNWTRMPAVLSIAAEPYVYIYLSLSLSSSSSSSRLAHHQVHI
jgi:hypothetical protein